MRILRDEEKYIGELFSVGDSDLAPVRAELEKHNVQDMSISGAEARFLQFLIRGFGVRKVVEFGTLFGYSALCMAKALPEDGVVYTLENNPRNHAVAAAVLAANPAGRKVRSKLGDANELAAQIAGEGPFDMVFIDANKGGYCGYLDWAETHVRKGGLIVGDNTFLWGSVFDKPRERDLNPNQIRVMKEFNRRLSDTAKYSSTMIPTSEGMTVAQKLF